MSLERTVFEPVERLATALLPRRTRIALAACAFIAFPILVLIAVQKLTWPWPRLTLGIVRFIVSVGFSGAFTCFAAILLAGWFCPSSRWFMHAPDRPLRFVNGCLVLARSWALVVLCLMAASPVLVLVVATLS